MTAEECAFPYVPQEWSVGAPGLTKRELFAAMLAQGMMANPNVLHLDQDNDLLAMAQIELWSVNTADALLAELAKEKK